MAYIGNPPADRYSSVSYQDLTGGTGTSFTLDYAVGSANEIEVFVNNVRQEPSVAYTVSGTALTMTGTIASTDDFYVVFQGKAQQTVTHPATHALEATDGTFTGDLTVDTSTLYVDSANNRVGVGTTSTVAQSKMTVAGNSLSITGFDNGFTSGGNRAMIDFGANYMRLGGLTGGGSTVNGIKFITPAGGDAAIIDSDGLKFNGDTAAANALDDFEFGTWTPDVSAGTITGTGHYIKVGSKVWIGFNLQSPSDTTSTTQLQINNLPFTPSANANNAAAGAVFSRYISPSPNATYIATNLYFYSNGGSSQYIAAKHSHINSSSFALFGEATYYTTS